MDAASRTGVDDMREIIEATRFRPMQARNKVFVIDEVHMLSRNAFNALLKTLEEPPPHVEFVFATTENAQGADHGAVALPAVRSAPGCSCRTDRAFRPHRRAGKRADRARRRWR